MSTSPARDAEGRVIKFDPRYPNRPNPHTPGTRRWSAWQTAQQNWNSNQINQANIDQANDALEQGAMQFAESQAGLDRRFRQQLKLQKKISKRQINLQISQFDKAQAQQQNQFDRQLAENRRISREAEINTNRLRAAQVIEDPSAGLLRRRSSDVARRAASTRGTERLRISTNSI